MLSHGQRKSKGNATWCSICHRWSWVSRSTFHHSQCVLTELIENSHWRYKGLNTRKRKCSIAAFFRKKPTDFISHFRKCSGLQSWMPRGYASSAEQIKLSKSLTIKASKVHLNRIQSNAAALLLAPIYYQKCTSEPTSICEHC